MATIAAMSVAPNMRAKHVDAGSSASAASRDTAYSSGPDSASPTTISKATDTKEQEPLASDGVAGAARSAEPASHARVEVPNAAVNFVAARARASVSTPEYRKRVLAEFPQLQSHTYLDFSGATPPPRVVVMRSAETLTSELLGNPHSLNAAGANCEHLVNAMRHKILNHFGLTNDEYSVVFTANATAALKLAGELFAFNSSKRSAMYYLRDCHNSVLGIREFARGCDVMCVQPAAMLNLARRDYSHPGTAKLVEMLNVRRDGPSLFCYPLQCNATGKRFPASWTTTIRDHAVSENTYVLIDCAAYCSSSRVDLSRSKPDFAAVSWYKVFGYPTGLGSLIVRRCLLTPHILRKQYFGGGTVTAVSHNTDWKVLKNYLPDVFEDGTLPFQQIVSLQHGFDFIESDRYIGGWEKLSKRTMSIRQYALERLESLVYRIEKDGVVQYKPMALVYSHHDNDAYTYGPVLNFNILDRDGDFVGHNTVENLANLTSVQLRSGCFCNPGACSNNLGNEFSMGIDPSYKCGDESDFVMYGTQPIGTVRISFGLSSFSNDVDTYISILKDFFRAIDDPRIEPIVYNEDVHYYRSKRFAKAICY